MIDELDRILISELQEDGRKSYVDLAKKLGVVEGTIRKRVNRLLQRNLVKIVAVPNLSELGYDFAGIMGLQVHMPELEQVGAALCQYQEVCYLVFVLGTYDIIAIVLAQSRKELADLIMHRIATIPGITKTETLITLRMIKGEIALLDTSKLIENLQVSPPRK